MTGLAVLETWSPLAGWLTTLEKREKLALYLADLTVARFDGMDDFVASVLARLAPHLTAEERWSAFEDLVASVRRRTSAFTPGQTTAACVGVDDAIRRLCGGAV